MNLDDFFSQSVEEDTKTIENTVEPVSTETDVNEQFEAENTAEKEVIVNEDVNSDKTEEKETANTKEDNQDNDTDDDSYVSDLIAIMSDKSGIEIDSEGVNENNIWDKLTDAYSNKVKSMVGAAATEEASKVYEYLANGGTLNELGSFLNKTENPILSIDESTEEGQKQIITLNFKKLGVDSAQIKAIVDSYSDTGELASKATTIKNLVKEQDDKAKLEFLEQSKQRKQQEIAYREQIVTKTREELNKTEIYGHKVSSKDRQELIDYMLKPITVKTENGSYVTTTKAELARMELQKDPVKYLIMLAMFEKNGLKLGGVTPEKNTQQRGNKVNNRSIYDKLKGKKKQPTKSKVELDNFFA